VFSPARADKDEIKRALRPPSRRRAVFPSRRMSNHHTHPALDAEWSWVDASDETLWPVVEQEMQCLPEATCESALDFAAERARRLREARANLAYGQATLLWKARLRALGKVIIWGDERSHRCGQQCNLMHVVVHAYRAPSAGRQGVSHHICVPQAGWRCSYATEKWHCSQSSSFVAMYDLFICERTGVPHICTEARCSGPFCCTSSLRTCALTGRAYADPEMTTGWQQDADAQHGASRHIAATMVDDPPPTPRKVAEAKSKRSRSLCDSKCAAYDLASLRTLCAEARDIIDELLPGGASRDAADDRSARESRQERDRVAATYLQQPHKSTVHDTKNALADVLLRPSAFLPRRIYIPSAARQRLIAMYAATITEWYAHLRHFGRDWPPSHLKFGSFVLSVLYMSKRGLEHSEQVLVPQDAYLASQLPSPNTLLTYHEAGINKSYASRFTNTSKAIRAYVIYLHERGFSLLNLAMQPFDSVMALSTCDWDALESLLRRRAGVSAVPAKRARLAIGDSAPGV